MKTTPKPRGLILPAAKIRGVLEGRVTQHRVPVKPQPEPMGGAVEYGLDSNNMSYHVLRGYHDGDWRARCPLGQPGDRLFVKETFWSKHDTDSDGYQTIDCGPYLEGGKEFCPGWDYCATPECFDPPACEEGQMVERWDGEPTPGHWWLAPPDDWNGIDEEKRRKGKWIFLPWGSMFTKHPAAHMPAWAARIWLEIESVRVERVNAISEADAQAEGVKRIELGPHEIAGMPVHPMTSSYHDAFAAFWQSRHPGSWDRNDWVWCLSFRRVEAS